MFFGRLWSLDQGRVAFFSKRVTLDDLVHVEREAFGAETIARLQFGRDFERLFRVSGFQAQ